MDQQTQRDYFARAVQLLGGNSRAARELDISERSVRMFIAGERRLHSGILEDIAKALIKHADECRAIERKLSPAFASNLNEANRPPLHSGSPSKGFPKPEVERMARKLGLKPRIQQED